MVAVPGLGSAAPPSVRRPVVDLEVGSGGPDDWRSQVSAVSISVHVAPEVGVANVVVARAGGPGAEVGDEAVLGLGFDDDEVAAVMTGTVAAVLDRPGGTRRLTIHDAAARLAGLRVDQGYAEQSTGDVVEDLADRAGVDVDRVDAGLTQPFLVIHRRRSAWAHVARLADVAGVLARIDGAGALVFAPPDEADPLAVDADTQVLHVDDQRHGEVVTGVTAIGEGAAGTQGADAWAWLAHDRATVTETVGDEPDRVVVRDPALRSPEAIQTAGAGTLARRARSGRTASLRVPGAPRVRPGGFVEVGGPTTGPIDLAGLDPRGGSAGPPGVGRWLVIGVRHRVGGAFTTDLDLVDGVAGEAGLLGGLAGSF